ncbi:MAG: signal recognition particle protein Srp54 [Thermoplasmata archaeon]|nr:signal recognition particle protein Srp54 [Thermoplasmata archaeon]
MVLDTLGQSLRGTLRKIANAPHIDKDLIGEIVRDLQRALLQADVEVKLAFQLTKRIEERGLTERPPAGTSSREHIVRIIYEELVHLVGEQRDVPLKAMRMMMVGLYGQGKTTTTAKLSRYFQKKGMKVGIIAADVHRPAAYDQLRQLAAPLNIPVFGIPGEKDAARVVRDGLASLGDTEVVIVDTSGRHALEDELIDEIRRISKVLDAGERFLVMDATIGQQAGPQAKAFHDAVNVTGVIITKLDGSAKGGGALSAVAVTEAPIVFIGVGERIEDLEHFDPPRFVSRLVGMGDVRALMEKAQEAMEEEDAEEVARKLLSGRFTLKDMYKQMEMLGRMGPLSKVMNLLPQGLGGGGRVPEGAIETTQSQLKKFRVIMDSMTEDEKEDPRIIKSSRIERIARGSGTTPKDVRELLNYYKTMKRTMKGFSSNRKMRRALMKQLEFPDEA